MAKQFFMNWDPPISYEQISFEPMRAPISKLIETNSLFDIQKDLDIQWIRFIEKGKNDEVNSLISKAFLIGKVAEKKNQPKKLPNAIEKIENISAIFADPIAVKKLALTSSSYLRTILRERSFAWSIMPPTAVR